MAKKNKPKSEKSGAVEIVFVKVTRKRICIKWRVGENERSLGERDEPLPSFRRAFEALTPIVGTICHFPAKYSETGLRVTELHIGSKGGVETAALTARKDLDDASKEFSFTTPERLMENPTEEGAYSPPLNKEDAGLIADAVREAKKYISGQRSQSEIVWEKADDDDGDDDAGAEDDKNQTSMALEK